MKSPKFTNAGSRRFVFSFSKTATAISRLSKKIGISLPVLAVLLSLFVTVPASAGISYPNASAWGFTQYIWSFFFDDDYAQLGRNGRPVSPGIDLPEINSDRSLAPMTIDGQGLAPTCIASGNPVINVTPTGVPIQTAINNAFEGDTIHLAAGTFEQQFRIDKCLFIEGEGEYDAVNGTGTLIQAPATLNNGIFNARSVVEAFGNYESSISGLTIQGRVITSGNPVFGVFASAGANIKMSQVTVRDIRDFNDSNFGLQNGRAIVAGWQGSFNTTGSVELDHVTVASYQKSGIYISRLGSSAIIKNSTITGEGGQPYIAQNGITIIYGATAEIEHNTITDNLCNHPTNCGPTEDWSYAVLSYSSGDITVKDNTITNNDGGVYSWTPGKTGTITDNKIDQTRYSGIDVDEGTATISDNWLSDGLNGVVVTAYSGAGQNSVADIQRNSITGFSGAGILMLDEALSDGRNPVTTAHFNRISGNGTGINNTINVTSVAAENNFWGCNEGPNNDPGCGSTTGSVVSSPWLKLSAGTASDDPINALDDSTISGFNLCVNSASANICSTTHHVLDGLTIGYTATNGTVAPGSGAFTTGIAAGTVFTAGGPFETEMTGTITGQIDNATATTNVTISDEHAPTVTINQAGADPTSNPAVTFNVVFSENVNGFDASDIDTTGTTAGIGTITVSPTTGPASNYTVTIDATSSGIVTASIPAGAATDDSANANSNAASTSTDNVVSYFTGALELVVDVDGLGTAFDCDANVLAYNNIPDAVAAAGAGYTIKVCPGTYPQSGTINLNKQGLTVIGVGASRPVVQVGDVINNSNYVGFNVTATAVTIQNLEIEKIGLGPQHNIVQVAAGDFTARDNYFHGPAWQTLDGDKVSRAFIINAGITNFLIDENIIEDFRQPAYSTGGSGTVSKNTWTGTKGWVNDGSLITFINNTMTTCAECDTDIALLNNSNSAYQNFYSTAPNTPLEVSGVNNNAHIDVQFTAANDSGRANTYVATTGSSTNDGRSTSPFASIQQAIYDPTSGIVDGTLPGGTVHVAAGTYKPGSGLPATARVLINRTIHVLGTSGAEATIIDGTNTAMSEAGLFRIETPATANGDSSISGFSFKNTGPGPSTRTSVYAKQLSSNSTVTVSNNRFYGVGAVSAPFDQALYAYHPRGKVVFNDNYVTGFGGNPVLLEQPEGGSDVYNNVFANNNSTAYFSMTYAIMGVPVNISNLQRVSNNTFYGSSSAISINGAFGSAGTYSNVEITNNVIHQLGASKTGINLSNGSADGTSGEISNVTVKGNHIVGVNSEGRGIRLAGLVTNANISCNMIASTNNGIVADAVSGNEPANTAVKNNNLSGNNIGVQNNGTSVLNAQTNFWGAADGPSGVGTGSGDAVSADVDFSSFLNAASTCAPALPETHFPTTGPNGWFYYDDVAESVITPNDYAYGPGAPVLGIGSARMNPSSLGTTKLLFATLEFAGTRLADINHFSYFSYVTSGDTPYVQMGIDDDVTDSDTTWKGRVVWVPSANGTTVPGTWQYWDANQGLFYGTQAPISGVCSQSNMCTRAELLAAFPNIGISNGANLGLLGFRADDASNASVDAVSIGTNTAFKTFDFEPTVPTLVSIVPSPAGPTNAASIDFTVTFSEPVTGFDLSDAVFSGISGTPSISGSGAVYTITFTPDPNQDGTLTLNIAAGAANGDPNGSPTSNGGSSSVDYDNVSPTVALTYLGTDPTNQNLSFTAVFTEDMTGFDAGDISVTNGTVANFQVVSGSSYTFDVVPGTSGPVTVDIPAAVATDSVGNPNTAATPISVTYDIDIPLVTVLHSGPASNTSPVSFTVTFSEPVTGFDAADVDLSSSTTGGILNASVTNTGDDKNFTVTVSGMANSGNVVLNIPAGAAVDTASNGNSASTPASSGSDTIAFTVDSSTTVITPSGAPGQNWSYYNDSTNSFITTYDFVYGPGTPTLPIGSAGMRTLQSTGNTSDLLAFGTTAFNGTALANITRLGYDTYVNNIAAGNVPTLQFNVDYDLTDTDTSYQGRVVWVPSQNGSPTVDNWDTWNALTPTSVFWYSALSPFASECTQSTPCTIAQMLAAHPKMGIHATFGSLLFRVENNSNAAVDNLIVGIVSDDTVFDFEPSVPEASISYGGSDPTNSTSIQFAVTFTEPVTDFDDAGDVALTNATFSSITSIDSTHYTLNVAPIADGTVTAGVNAHIATGDPSGVPNSVSSTQGSDSVVYDGTAPTATLSYIGPDPTNNSVLHFSVEFGELVTCGSLPTAYATVINGTTANLQQGTGTGTNCTFDVNASAQGTVSVSVNAGVMSDTSGNYNTQSNTVNVTYDSVRPGVTITGDATANTSPLTYTIAFTEPVSDFDVNDIDWTGTNTGGTLNVAFNTVSADEYTVTVSGMANSGDVVITVPENVAHDFTGGNGNTAGTFTTAFTVDSTPVIVTASNAAANHWRYYDDTASAYLTGYDFMYGPGTPPAGYGSAGMRSSVMGTNEIAFMTSEFGGTRFADITKLTYKAYYAAGSTGGMPDLQFNVDYDGASGNDGWQGRVNYTPAMNDPVRAESRNTWETWDAMDSNAKFWITQQQTGLTCTQAVPCTRAQMLAAYPNMRLHIDVGTDPATAFSALLFRTDGAGDAAVDDFTVGINSEDKVFDFEPTPTVSIASTTPGAEPSTGNVFTVTLSGRSSVPVTVDYNFTDGSADEGNDYTGIPGTITFPADTTTLSQTITVPTLSDTIAESTEDFTVTLSNPLGATLGTASATGTIADSGAYISISGNISQFGGSGLGGVTVNLAGGATQSTVTDSNGNYVFNTGLPVGDGYLVTPVPTVGKIFDPISRNYDTVLTNVTDADFIEYNVNSIPRNLKVVNANATPGEDVVVPISIESLGNERDLSFSLEFDPAYLDGVVAVDCGSSIPSCGISLNTSQLAVGKLGVLLDPDTIIAAGTQEVVTVTFSTTLLASSVPNTAVIFSDAPTTTSTSDANGNLLATMYTAGSVVFGRGWEGDVALRFEGSGANNPTPAGAVNAGDVTIMRQFVLGNISPDPLYNEFQRADVAPTSTKGNGSVNAGDLTIVRQFTLGALVPQSAGGPFVPVSPFAEFGNDLLKHPMAERGTSVDYTIVSQNSSPGSLVTIPIRVRFNGIEYASTFSVQFDETVLENPQVQLAPGVPGAISFTLSEIANGRLGLLMDSATPYPAGTYDFVYVTFHVKAGATPGITPVSFTNTPVSIYTSDINGADIPHVLSGGTVTIAPSTAAGVAVEGRVLTAGGSPIANAQVLVTDEEGRSFSTRANSFGNFGIKGIPGGRTYILTARAKGHSFQAQTVTLNQSVTTINLVSD